MDLKRKTKETYKGPQDLANLLNADEWSPTSLFPQPARLDTNIFPPRPQPYLDLIKRLSQNGRPDLKYLYSEFHRQFGGLHAERSRAVVLEFSDHNPAPQQVPFPTSNNLERYLKRTSMPSCSRLYILEDISVNYVEVFGTHLSIEPSFWAQHLRTVDRETSKTAGPVCALPSVRSGDSSISFIYPEYSIIDDADEKFSEEPKIRTAHSLFADCNLYRKITLIPPGEFYDGIATVNRRATFWSRMNPGGTWDALILVDPPILRIDKEGHRMRGHFIYSHDFSKGKMVKIDVSHNAPNQGGYVDFMPINHANASNYTGPPRTSLFDDLKYYHSLPNASPNSHSTPDTAIFFLQNILAGIWMNSIAYVNMSVSSLELALEKSRKHLPSSAPNDHYMTSYGGLEWLEKNLFHIYSWKRRCAQLHDWSDWNLQELEIAHAQLRKNNAAPKSASIVDQDWAFIKKRLQLCDTCSRDIVASALGLLSLIESHKSVEEAESARVLALLGTVYLPLSLTAGVLSMGGTFTPGQSQFWIFFAVAAPLMVLSLGATYLPTMFSRWIPKTVQKMRKDPKGVKRTPTFAKEFQETV